MTQFQLLRARRFGPLFWTQCCGAFNDNLFKNALVMLIVFQSPQFSDTMRTQLVALCQGLFILPFFLVSAVAGQWADRADKARIARWVKLAEIGLMLLLAWGLPRHALGALLPLLFGMGLHSTVFGPIKFGILPQHLHHTELTGGNGLIEMGTFLAILLGTVLAGVLMPLSHGPAWISGLALGIAVVGWLASRAIPPAPAVDRGPVATWHPWRITRSLYRTVRTHRTIHLAILGISWFWFFGAFLLTLLPLLCKDLLGGDESVVTVCLLTFCVGIGLGSLACERLSGRHVEIGLVPFGSIGMTLFTLDLFLTTQRWVATPSLTASALLQSTAGWHLLLDLFGLSAFAGFFVVPLQAMIQHRAPVAMRSRIIAANNIINAVFIVASALIAMVFFHFRVGMPIMLAWLALSTAAVAAFIYGLIPEFLYRFMAWLLVHSVYRLEVHGAERIPERGAAVLIANHVSYVDGLIVAAAASRPVRFIMDHQIASHPIIRYFAQRGRAIPIAGRKDNAEVLASAFDAIAEGLARGELLCIFPEGRLTRDGEMNPFRPGIEQILARTPVPVVPMALRGLWGSYFSRAPGRRWWRLLRRFRSRVTLIIADPMAPEHATAAHLQTLVAKLRGDEP